MGAGERTKDSSEGRGPHVRLAVEQGREIDLLREVFPNVGSYAEFARHAVNERIDRLWELAEVKKAKLRQVGYGAEHGPESD